MNAICETMDQRIAQEAFLTWADGQPKYITRNVPYDFRNNVIAVLKRFDSKKRLQFKKYIFTKNLVTDDGDIYYAKKGAGETPSTNENFLQGRIELRNMADTPAKADNYGAVLGPITASRKTISATYPKSNDSDTDNTGRTIDSVSYKYEWTTTDFNDAAIQGGCIHDNAAPVAGTKLLNHFSITSFAKSSSDTLKMYVNHLMNGV